ncbi:MAG: DUF4040 domain-containing protein, partial [Campylobacteraceae bacterium]|nr:DUF4040 domain-containing protein [Campylobacteraceae bacterium]
EKYLSQIDARILYYQLVDSSFEFALKAHNSIHKGLMRPSIYILITTSLLLGAFGFSYGSGPLLGSREFLAVDWISIVVVAVLVVGTFTILFFHRQRLLALIVVGIVGLVVVLTFIKLSAPDLALTQLSVEMVTIVLMLLALFYLPAFTPKESSSLKVRGDILLSSLAGIGVSILSLAVLSRDYSSTIGDYFLANALKGGGGTNVVNVILVDFRGFDTLGEITVLGIAGIGIFALLQGLRLYAPPYDARGYPWALEVYPPIMQVLMRILLPIMLLVAVYIFLRGHNLPGGGFVAGLIASVALIVQYLANGIGWASKRLLIDKHFLIGSGVLIAGATGVVSMLIGFPFLTSAFIYLDWPIVGEFEVASAIAFDLGVFLVVVGATVMILVQLGKLSLTSHKLTKTKAKEEDAWKC